MSLAVNKVPTMLSVQMGASCQSSHLREEKQALKSPKRVKKIKNLPPGSGSGGGSGSDSVDSEDLKDSIIKVCRSMLKSYPSKDDMYNEIDNLKEDLREEMIEDLKPMFQDMTLEMI
jgi:hypothetical protein